MICVVDIPCIVLYNGIENLYGLDDIIRLIFLIHGAVTGHGGFRTALFLGGEGSVRSSSGAQVLGKE